MYVVMISDEGIIAASLVKKSWRKKENNFITLF